MAPLQIPVPIPVTRRKGQWSLNRQSNCPTRNRPDRYTYLHFVEPHSGDMQPSRPEQAAGGVLQTDRNNRLFTFNSYNYVFTAINQMMTEGVDLTLVIRKANGQLAVSTFAEVERAEGRGSEPHRTACGQGAARGTGCRIHQTDFPPDPKSFGTHDQHGAARGAGGEGCRRKQGGEGCKGQGDERGEREREKYEETH